MKSFKTFFAERCWPGYKSVPGKKAYSPGSCVKESAAAAIAAATAIAKKKSGNYDEKGFRKTPYKNPDSPNRKSNAERKAELKEDLRKWFSKTDPAGDWKRINSKGEAIGPCAREPGEPKPKCMSRAKRESLTKKERASAVASKRKHDPNPERKGAPINVSNFGKGKISENMENLDEKNVPTSPEKWAQAKSQAKAKFDVYPSAYANGWASKKYKEMGGGWKSVSEESETVHEGAVSSTEKVITVKHKTSGKTLRVTAQSAAKYRTMGYHQVSEAKDEKEYGYEGDMALNQLATLIRCGEMIKDMLKPDTDMPEWVQSKITLATDYIQTAADYLYSEMKEEVELAEVLSKDASAGDWIHDFIHSDNPKFAGKSKEQRQKQALAAYYAKKNEEVEQIEEISDDLAGRYLKKANSNLIKKVGMKPDLYNHLEPKRQKGATRALNRLMKPVKEESLDELSKDTVTNYMQKRLSTMPTNDKDAHNTIHGLVGAHLRIHNRKPAQPYNSEIPSQQSLVPQAKKPEVYKDETHGRFHATSPKNQEVKVIASPRKNVSEGRMKDIVTDKEETERLKKREGSWSVEGKWKTSKANVTDKSGAKHTPMSRARDLARASARRNAGIKEDKATNKANSRLVPKINLPGSITVNESRKMEIVREAMKDAMKKDAKKKQDGKLTAGKDKFIADPELTSQIVKTNN